MKLRCCIFAGGRPKALNEFQLKTLKTPNLNWADGFPVCFGGFFRILLMKLSFCIFAGGRPRALSKFPLEIPKTPNLNWVDGFPLCFGGFLRDVACEISLLHFCRREAQGI